MKFILYISVFFLGITFANSNTLSFEKERAIKLLVYEERTIDALKIFIQEINKSSKQKNNSETADNMYRLAECIFLLKQFAALDTVISICENFTKQYNYNAYLKLKTIEGKYLIEKGKYSDCISLLTNLTTQTRDRGILCEMQLTLADANQRKQELEKSRAYYQYVIRNTKDTIQIGRAYNGLGSYYCVLSKLDSAKIFYDIAYSKFHSLLGEQHTRIAQVHYNLGLVADRNYDLFTAEQHFIRALSVYKKRLGDLHPRTAEAYGTLGSLLFMKDNPGKALYYSVKERDILLKLYGNENPDLVYSYLNCGKIYYLLNEPGKSEKQLILALELIVKSFGKQHNLYSQCIVELSKIYTSRNQYSKAEKILSEVIQLKHNNEDDYLADVYQQSGENYLLQEQTEKAFYQFEKANKLYIQYYGDKNIYSIEPLLGMSEVYLKKGKTDDALIITKKALTITKNKQQVIYPNDYWICIIQLLKCRKYIYEKNLPSNQNIKKDIELIKQTLQKATQIKNTLYTTGSQSYYAEKMAELNQLGIYYLTHFYSKSDSNFINNLLYFAENNKANLLRNKIVNYKADEILPLAEKSTSSKISGKLNYFISLNENQADVNFNINDSILFYQNKYEIFTKSIEQKYPKIYALKYKSNPLTINQIQQFLKPDETFLEYFNDGSMYYCLSISKRNITFKNCGNKTKTDSIIRVYLASVLHKKADNKLSNRLYKDLLPKTLTENLIISSDATLQQLSFEALQNNSSEYMINEYSIQYTFSANTYFNHQPALNCKKITAFYPDFTNSQYAVLNNQKEHDVLKLFPEYHVFYQQNANKENFISHCNLSGITHIASHLIIDTISPLQSVLVFQPMSNYRLSINEIWKLNANCQLITLASCQSNFGKQQNGEGMQNFAWAFHYAGARNILSTQWNAADKSTSTIISEFYKILKAGKSKQKALQLAKINYLKNTDAIGAQPFFWANYSLIGDATAIKMAPNFLSKYWWLPIVFLCIFFVIVISYRKLFLKYYAE